MSEPTIPLAEVIQQLREQLQEAVDAAKGKDLRFRVADLELELQVAVTKSGGVKGGGEGDLKFLIFDAKAKTEVTASYGVERVQKIKLRLEPVGSDGSDEDILVAAEGRVPGLKD